MEAVYFLERSASDSSESFVRAEQAARALHREFWSVGACAGSVAAPEAWAAGQEERRHKHEHEREADRSAGSHAAGSALVALSWPALVAVDLSRQHEPFRLVDV